MPTNACPVMKAGRGHTLSPTVTGGVWPDDITYDRMKVDKGVGFVPGGEVPSKVRTTAWDFMGQNIPRNYGMLVFAQPLSTPDAFDPSNESIHGLLSGSSHQREEPSNDDEPVSDPYTHPRGSSHQGEAPRGSSHQGEAPRGSSHQRGEPQRGTSAAHERWWEDQGHLQALLKKNMALKNMTCKNLFSKKNMKSWKKQQPFGKVTLWKMMK